MVNKDNGTMVNKDNGTMVNKDNGTMVNKDNGTMVNKDNGTMVNKDNGQWSIMTMVQWSIMTLNFYSDFCYAEVKSEKCRPPSLPPYCMHALMCSVSVVTVVIIHTMEDDQETKNISA